MRAFNTDARYCSNPEIIAGRLASIRHIYLREELCTIANQIQRKHKECLPTLHLVAIAAYEQVFNRQPLAFPKELRQDAIKYGLRYFEVSMEKLRMAEVRNRHDLPAETEIDENQSNLQRSSEESTNENTFDPTSISSNESSIVGTNGRSPSADTFSENKSNGSIETTKTGQSSRLTKKLSRTKPPKIIVRRASDNSLTSITSKSSSMTVNHNPLSPNKEKDRRK